MAIAYFDDYSRYRNSQPILANGVQTMGMWVPPSWIRQRPPNDFIRTYMVQPGVVGRPDLIAQEIYDNHLLDWVLVMFNRPQSVFGWPQQGLIIEYPVESLVFMEL